MPCIQPDGTLTLTAMFVLKSLGEGPLPPEEIARRLGEPVFKVRGSLREMMGAGLIEEAEGAYRLTELGRGKLK